MEQIGQINLRITPSRGMPCQPLLTVLTVLTSIVGYYMDGGRPNRRRERHRENMARERHHTAADDRNVRTKARGINA